MNKKYLLVGFIISMAIVVAVYGFLGGFNKPKIELVNGDGYTIAGVMFKGNFKDEKLRSLFFKTKMVPGTLTILNYPELETKEGYVENFVGVMNDNFDNIPDHFEIKNYSFTKAIRVTIKGNTAVRPHPRDIREMVYEYAGANGLVPDSVFIEQYVNDRELIIDVPVE